jgi:hypothetical protein
MGICGGVKVWRVPYLALPGPLPLLSPLLQAALTACGATVPHDTEIWSRRGH